RVMAISSREARGIAVPAGAGDVVCSTPRSKIEELAGRCAP
ncbi:hypothetical protein Tco_0560393, partial [Tanacetum coccineum]